MNRFSSIDGGVSRREKIAMPACEKSSEDDEISRGYIIKLLQATADIFGTFDIPKGSVSAEDISETATLVEDIITQMKQAKPNVYNYYEWLYDRLSGVIRAPNQVPKLRFVTEVYAVAQLADIDIQKL